MRWSVVCHYHAKSPGPIKLEFCTILIDTLRSSVGILSFRLFPRLKMTVVFAVREPKEFYFFNN